jgi:hypothetical protein
MTCFTPILDMMENHQRFSAFGFFLARFSPGGRDGGANERKDFFLFGKMVRMADLLALLVFALARVSVCWHA